MPESRTKPSRKGKVKSMPVKERDRSQEPIFRQPTWNADDLFTINGETLEMFATFIEPYRMMTKMIDTVIASGELEDKIKIKFYYSDGTPVSDSDARLAGLQEAEDKRLNHWKELVNEKSSKLDQWAKESKEALEAVETLSASLPETK